MPEPLFLKLCHHRQAVFSLSGMKRISIWSSTFPLRMTATCGSRIIVKKAPLPLKRCPLIFVRLTNLLDDSPCDDPKGGGRMPSDDDGSIDDSAGLLRRIHPQ